MRRFEFCVVVDCRAARKVQCNGVRLRCLIEVYHYPTSNPLDVQQVAVFQYNALNQRTVVRHPLQGIRSRIATRS